MSNTNFSKLYCDYLIIFAQCSLPIKEKVCRIVKKCQHKLINYLIVYSFLSLLGKAYGFLFRPQLVIKLKKRLILHCLLYTRVSDGLEKYVGYASENLQPQGVIVLY